MNTRTHRLDCTPKLYAKTIELVTCLKNKKDIIFILHLSFSQMWGATFYNEDTDRKAELPVFLCMHIIKWPPDACFDELH